MSEPDASEAELIEAAMAAGPLPEGEMHPLEAAPLGPEITLDVLARRLPKAELHLHFGGGFRPSFVWRMARQQGIDIGMQPTPPDSIYDYAGFSKFIADMRRVSAILTNRESIEEAALDMLEAEVDGGARHVEMMVTLGYHAEVGIDPSDTLQAVAAAFARARDYWDLTGGIIAEFDRPAGPDAAVEIAQAAVAAAERGLPVVGVGNDGDPILVPMRDLAPGYEVARQGGLKLCGHVDMPWDVPDALLLGLDRIDHGFSALAMPDELAQIVERQIPMTICPTSNVMQGPGLYPDIAAHPVGGLIEAGAYVTLNADDPPMFFTDLAQEYRSVARALAWGAADMAAIARRSLEAAWLPPGERDDRLATWERESDALLADARRTR
jgi:adenosine deaminase